MADDRKKEGGEGEIPGESRTERRRRRFLEGRKRPDKEASCPYCGEILERPHGIGITRRSGFRGGACGCGAIYLLDENGFHGGEAIVELLTLLYGDWETAWQHVPGEDYEEIDVPYDERNHRIAEPDDVGKPESILYFARKKQDGGST